MPLSLGEDDQRVLAQPVRFEPVEEPPDVRVHRRDGREVAAQDARGACLIAAMRGAS